MSSVGNSRFLRLFLALWPDEELRANLTDLTRSLERCTAGKWMRPDNLHVTLAFLGNVEEDRFPVIREIAAGSVGESFVLGFERAEFWRRSEIVCLAPTETPDALASLADELTRSFRDSGFPMENRPYRPHLTLARQGRCDWAFRTLSEPLIWSVSSFVLVESRMSREGSTYVVRERWGLRR
jgi:2'-5' RNA ligase